MQWGSMAMFHPLGVGSQVAIGRGSRAGNGKPVGGDLGEELGLGGGEGSAG